MCIAIECSYKLDQKNKLKFLCELRRLVFAETVTYDIAVAGKQSVVVTWKQYSSCNKN